MIAPPKIIQITDIRLPEAEILNLPSGQKICCVRGEGADVVRLRIVWPGGERECRLPQVAQIGCQLIPECSAHYPDSEPARIFDFNGAKFSLSCTAHHTVLTLTCLSSRLDNLLPVVEDIIKAPELNANRFELMREIVAMRYATLLVDVDERSAMLMSRVMRGQGHPYNKTVTPDIIRNISLSEVVDFYNHTLRNGTAAMAFVSGNFTDENLRSIEKLLADMPSDGATAVVMPPFLADEPGVYTEHIEGALQAGIRMSLPVPGAASADGVNIRNAITALGGYFGSRLMRNIREDKGYTYGIQAFMLNNPEGASMRISTQTDVSLAEAVIEETRKEMQLLVENPPVGEELERVRQSLALELAAVADTPFSVADEYMRQFTGLVPANFFSRRVESLSTLSPEIVAATASSYLCPDGLRIAVVTQK